MKFWMHSKDKKLRQAIKKYFNEQEISELDVILIRNYMKQWVKYLPFLNIPQQVIKDIQAIETKEDIKNMIMKLLDYGVDPF